MKFEINRQGIRIIPENDQDVAYIEDTLGLRQSGARIDLMRVNVMGLGAVAYLETQLLKAPEKGEIAELIRKQIVQ